jgi:predicted DsbA family dithiol-disulfide isomerase
MMKAYFSEEKYLNDRAVLLEAAVAAGVPDAETVLDDPTVSASIIHIA